MRVLHWVIASSIGAWDCDNIEQLPTTSGHDKPNGPENNTKE